MAKRNKSSKSSGRAKPMSGTASINRRYDEDEIDNRYGYRRYRKM